MDHEPLPPDRDEHYEQRHVHAVYDRIATHFSSTRHKPWPVIAQFLRDQRPGSVGLDVGCGNGKYFGVNPDVLLVGSDRSCALAAIAATTGTAPPAAAAAAAADAKLRPHPHPNAAVLTADVLALPHPPATFDFAICIAVVHHLCTSARRARAIAAVLETLRPGGRALLYVWALEQPGSRRGWTVGDAQDVMVPWVVRGAGSTGPGGDSGIAGDGAGADRVVRRYYHLYRRGELERDVEAAGGVVVEAGYERDNWWAIASRKGG